jgi:hypothetical protein
MPVQVGQLWQHEDDGRYVRIARIWVTLGGATMIDAINERTGAPLAPVFGMEWPSMFRLILEDEPPLEDVPLDEPPPWIPLEARIPESPPAPRRVIKRGQLWTEIRGGYVVRVTNIQEHSQIGSGVDRFIQVVRHDLDIANPYATNPYEQPTLCSEDSFLNTFRYFCDAFEGEAMPRRPEPGQMWQRKDGSVQTVQILETDWLEPDNGEVHVRYETTNGIAAMPESRFRREYTIMLGDRTPTPRTAYDQLIEDDLLPQPPPVSEMVISSVTVKCVGDHDRVQVWNRGGMAGELTVSKGDGEALKRRLLGGG